MCIRNRSFCSFTVHCCNCVNGLSWFVGFAPAETPEIVVSVVLEGGYSGISSAQYIAKAVFDAYFQ